MKCRLQRLHTLVIQRFAIVSEEHGWTIVNWCLEPFWIDDDLLQPRKVDILEKTPGASRNDVKKETVDDSYEMVNWMDVCHLVKKNRKTENGVSELYYGQYADEVFL